jgi:hypothetical protein
VGFVCVRGYTNGWAEVRRLLRGRKPSAVTALNFGWVCSSALVE